MGGQQDREVRSHGGLFANPVELGTQDDEIISPGDPYSRFLKNSQKGLIDKIRRVYGYLKQHLPSLENSGLLKINILGLKLIENG